MNADSVVYDLCSGSGCVAISVAKMTGARVFAFEKYESTLKVLEENIALNHYGQVKALCCDITRPGNFNIPKADVILSNPPYIQSADIASLQAEVLKEPLAALHRASGAKYFKICF